MWRFFAAYMVTDVSKRGVAYVLKMQGPWPSDEAYPGSYRSQDSKTRLILTLRCMNFQKHDKTI
jgi:hypothetical protein